eukprot:TRINITY_DN15242_c0_g1_i1.p1 TRINITY_DN15242_c0_g1~~TRINITY_DN15242_c0_g1_i1.p1  ORF type:complete len:306 (-),score=69.18 TRINITY_DN15242_c0_g1_i1:65-982(-)
MDKRPIGYIPGKGNPLDKKVPKNPKYEKVTSTIDTGMTVRNIEVVSNQAIAKRKGELFRRIKASTLANLLRTEKNAENIYNMKDEYPGESLEEMKISDTFDNQSIYSVQTQTTNKTNATHISAITYATQQLGINDETSFLLLDLREPEDYALFHIQESTNFPGPNVLRDKTLPEFYRFKNKENRLIIVYHLDERSGIPFAAHLYEKGYENVYLLSGGIEDFLKDYPDLVEGKAVPVIPKKTEKKVILKRTNHNENPQNGTVVIKERGPTAGVSPTENNSGITTPSKAGTITPKTFNNNSSVSIRK